MPQTPELIHGDECIDDLRCGGLMLIQKRNGFKFGIDAVLLADFAKSFKSSRTVDLCSGTGIVAVLLAAKTKTPVIDALEIQPDICDMAKRSALYNDIDDRVRFECEDLKNAPGLYGKSVFDAVTVNPPYMKAGSGLLSRADTRAVSRHELLCGLDDVISASAALLKPGGRLFMVHRPSRLADILCLMREYKTEPKRLRLVHPCAGKAPNLLLIEGVRGGGAELKLTEPLYVYDGAGNYSDEINRIYGIDV